jgi:signal transduction histidine kinase
MATGTLAAPGFARPSVGVRAISAAAIAVAAGVALLAVVLSIALPPDAVSAAIALLAVGFLPVPLAGLILARSAPRNAVGWIFLAAGASFATACACLVATRAALVDGDTAIPIVNGLALVGALAWVGGVPLVSTFGILLFPDGHLPTPRWRALGWASAAALCACALFAGFGSKMLDYPDRDNPTALPGALVHLADACAVAIVLLGPLSVAGALALRGRARREPTPARATALRGLAICAVVVAVSYAAAIVVTLAAPSQSEWVTVGEASAALAYALAAGAGIARHGVGDLRIVVGRGLLFATLSALAVGVYLAVAAAAGLAGDGVPAGMVSTVVAVLVVLAVRGAVHQRLNRLVYGLRDEPGTALASLALHLDAAAALDDVLPAAARTVADALRLPYVAVELEGVTLAAHGAPGRGAPEAIPLVFTGEVIGQLRLEARVAEGGFSAADRRALEPLARHIAVAAHAVWANRALQSSRARLLTAREEERRRLRSDLHDGLGPTLVGMALGIDAVARALPSTEVMQSERLDRLRVEAEDAVAEVRRLIYDLRPPALDHLGLAGAIHEQAQRLGATVVELPEDVPPLEAAIEVATYRIAAEAMANAARHAPEAPFELRLRIDGELCLDVVDSGPGLPETFHAGVGIASMRERAALLGGTCTIERRHPRGTAVRVRLPLAPA